jgi:DNA mismatch endonuclease, patch repair protein
MPQNRSINLISITLPEKTSSARKTMQRNRSKDTGPELALRRALRNLGLKGYRVSPSHIQGKPDVVFIRARVCVFVHGCFWHGCLTCAKKRNLRPRTNASYWEEKRRRNTERDQVTKLALEADGWLVLILWECEIKEAIGQCAHVVLQAVTQGPSSCNQPTSAYRGSG